MPGAKLDENKILYRLRTAPNPDDFGVLYDTYVKQIYRFVYFKVGGHEEAEDIASEVFLKAWHYIQAKKEVKSFRGLLYSIARNCVIDLYRARALRPEVLMGEEIEASDAGNWEKEFQNKDESQAVLTALKKLKQEYKEVITLRYIEELEIHEIAGIIGKSRVGVRVTLHRAIKKLEEMLGRQI
ncbi:MAG: sigma-70 family RNA polymerase sigma factor [Candidatus Magasanikbacteria bacterium]|nr:sigma-70 family RNA polymerase sigma factor [Candidatus Magasanikbacteria bacterium]